MKKIQGKSKKACQENVDAVAEKKPEIRKKDSEKTTVQISVYLTRSEAKKLDKARGLVPIATFIRHTLKEKGVLGRKA